MSYDYLLLSSFEYTCDGRKSLEPREMIEFCVVKYNVSTHKCEEKFYSLVKPAHEVNAKLSTFCKMLTGITDKLLETAPLLDTVLRDFDTWLWREGLHQKRFIFVPYEHFDLFYMLSNQCNTFDYHCPAYFFSWIHLEKLHSLWLSEQAAKPGNKPAKKVLRRSNTLEVLKSHGVKHEGRQHSAVDNCTNTSNLVTAMLQKGADLSHVWTTPSKEEMAAPQVETERADPLAMLTMKKVHDEIQIIPVKNAMKCVHDDIKILPVKKGMEKCHDQLLNSKK